MSEETSKKDVLITRAIKLGIGDDKFLSKMSEENLKNMIALIESKNGKIAKLESKTAPVKNPKVVTVADLVAAKRIGVATVEPEAADPEPEEGE